MMEGETTYNANSLDVLPSFYHIRKRPAMYVGGTDQKGLHQLFSEVTDNAVNEAMAGRCSRIDVRLHHDGSVSVCDNGRGFPVEINQHTGDSAIERLMTVLNAGRPWSNECKVFGDVGVVCVNALSERLTADVWRDGTHYRIGFSRGRKVEDLHVVGAAEPGKHGTKLRWKPDPEIFGDAQWNAGNIVDRLRELAYLNNGVAITFQNERDLQSEGQPTIDGYAFHGRLSDFVERLHEGEEPIHEPVYLEGSRQGIHLEAAFQYNRGYVGNLHSFANMYNCIIGGTHLSGFKRALTRILNRYALTRGHTVDASSRFTGDDVREGLSAVISVKMPNPIFESSTWCKLTSPEAEGVVDSVVGHKLREFLDTNPDVARTIIDKVIATRNLREAARKTAETARSVRRKSAPKTGSDKA